MSNPVTYRAADGRRVALERSRMSCDASIAMGEYDLIDITIQVDDVTMSRRGPEWAWRCAVVRPAGAPLTDAYVARTLQGP